MTLCWNFLWEDDIMPALSLQEKIVLFDRQALRPPAHRACRNAAPPLGRWFETSKQ
jgi:hypothetical protein